MRYDYTGTIEETKGGVFIYDGTPSMFHEWEFRTTVRWGSCKADDRMKTMSTIIESLLGEASLVAMDIGMTALMTEEGCETLLRRFYLRPGR